jgi:hypothetical protein
MSAKNSLWVTFVVFPVLFAGCAQAPEPTTQPEPPKVETKAEEPEEVRVYDLVEEDITGIQGLASRNLAVMGVKLGDRTAAVNQNKRLGKPIKTDSMGKLYRTAYQDRGIYLDFESYTSTVIAVYVNTSLAKKVKGKFASVLTRGNLKLLKSTFGDHPVRIRRDLQTTSWVYPKKGVEFIQTRTGDQSTYTLKLVKPRRR